MDLNGNNINNQRANNEKYCSPLSLDTNTVTSLSIISPIDLSNNQMNDQESHISNEVSHRNLSAHSLKRQCAERNYVERLLAQSMTKLGSNQYNHLETNDISLQVLLKNLIFSKKTFFRMNIYA